MKKIMVIFGTRPEAIKMCPLINELKKHPARFHTIVCVTGQHRQMLDQFLKLFNVTPDFDLNIMQNNQSLIEISTRILTEINKAIKHVMPDLIIVQGDTTTTFAASLAAYYNMIKIAHVEAGLRTYNKYSPFPEEINRRLTSIISDIHYAPTEKAKNNLLSEGIRESQIVVTGNTVIDALIWVKNKIKSEKKWYKCFENINFNNRLILMTGHRRENFGQDLINICNAIKTIGLQNKNVQIIYPVHLNPNVQGPVYQILNNADNIILLDPLEYEPFVYLMDKSYFIISDSGGIQEEAPSLGKPVLVTRNITERPEALEAGTVKLVGTDSCKIILEADRLLNDASYYSSISNKSNPFGDGQACKRIVDNLTQYLS